MTLVKIIVGIGVAFYVITCAAIIDIAQKDFGSLGKKAMWGFIALIPFAGCLLYFLIGFRKGVKHPPNSPTAT